jgi:hypothetical protein
MLIGCSGPGWGGNAWTRKIEGAPGGETREIDRTSSGASAPAGHETRANAPVASAPGGRGSPYHSPASAPVNCSRSWSGWVPVSIVAGPLPSRQTTIAAAGGAATTGSQYKQASPGSMVRPVLSAVERPASGR